MTKQYRAFSRKLVLLSEAGKPATRVELLRCGKFYGYGPKPINITPEMLKSMVKNFNDGVRGIDLAIDYQHNNEAEAAAWIKGLTYDAGGKRLLADVEWTPSGAKKLGDKEFRYLSAEFHDDYADNEAPDEKHGPTLLGAGLTNRPFVKGMEPVISLSEDKSAAGVGVLAMTPEEMTAAIQQLQAMVEKIAAGGPATPAAPPAPKAPVDNGEDDSQDENEIESDVDKDQDDDEAQEDADQNQDESDEHDDGADGASSSDGNGDEPAANDDSADASKDGGHEVNISVKTGGKKPPPPAAVGKKPPPSFLKKKPQPGGGKPPPKKMSEGEAMTEAEKKEFDALKARNAELESKIAEGEKAKQLAEKKGQFDKMLSEGKAVEGQREPFMAGDMVKFAEAAKPAKTTRLSDAGADVEGDGGGESDPQDEIKKLAEKLVADKAVKTLSDGYSKVLNDPKHAELRKRYEDSTYNNGTARATAAK